VALNESCADAYAKTIPVELEVLALSNGEVVGRRGIFAGRTVRLGPSAAVRIGGLTMLVCSRRVQCADPAFFEALESRCWGILFALVKSRGHFRAGFDPWYSDDRILEVDAAGLTSPMLDRYPWKALPRPVWPLDPDTQWQPPSIDLL
jgi:microcystin degradation protein MlrC